MSSEKLGLRERKKVKTRAAIQRHALHLFKEQGYAGTTIEQIAEAAEISPSTFFRYFPTKESVVLEDDYDPLLVEAFRRQPKELTALQALRSAIREGREQIPIEEQKALLERMKIIESIPELRIAVFSQIIETIQMMAGLAAERAGRSVDDQSSLTFAGAAMGAVLSAQLYCMRHPEKHFFDAIDESLEYLEAGLPL